MICNSYKSFFKILADDCKLNVINILSKGPLTVSELCKKLECEQSRISHCLQALKKFGFVASQVKGKHRVYSLEPKIMVPLLKLIDEHVEKYHRNLCKCNGVTWREMK
ncbi:winged helix-turn-helix transcriptional regulator [Candidatus Woesearchaeota archaeon]|nr:winged helix-turn-helix transcriptional regulator [Candidatus Woesearchaeota archaeon]